MAAGAKGFRLGAEAWQVVLDAGARDRARHAQAWGELTDLGLADADGLVPLWQDVAVAMGRPRWTGELVSRSGERQMATRLWGLAGVIVLATRRRTMSGEGAFRSVTGEEPTVLVQVAEPASVWDCVVNLLPPVDLLRAEPGIADAGLGPVVPTAEQPDLGDGVVVDLRAADADQGSSAGWTRLDEAPGDDLVPDEARLRALGAWLDGESSGMPEGDGDLDELVDLLRRSPLAPGLVDTLLDDVTHEVTLVVHPHQRPTRPTAQAPLALLGGAEMRRWSVTPHGLVSVRLSADGADVRGREPGALARDLGALLVELQAP